MAAEGEEGEEVIIVTSRLKLEDCPTAAALLANAGEGGGGEGQSRW